MDAAQLQPPYPILLLNAPELGGDGGMDVCELVNACARRSQCSEHVFVQHFKCSGQGDNNSPQRRVCDRFGFAAIHGMSVFVLPFRLHSGYSEIALELHHSYESNKEKTKKLP